MIARNYVEFNEAVDFEIPGRIDTENDPDFYDRRMEKINTLLNAEYTFGNYTEAEKIYWLRKARQIPTPFSWGSIEIWDTICRSIAMSFYLFLVISLCIAPVFSGEYQNRTDALLLTTRHGKTKVITAKILASFAFTFLYTAFCNLISMGIMIASLGINGWNLPVQLWDTIIPYQMTAAEACAVNLLIMFLVAFLLTACSLLLSAINRSPMIVLAIDILLFFGTIFLSSSKTSGLWNKILLLLPMNCIDLLTVLRSYRSYPFGINHSLSFVYR